MLVPNLAQFWKELSEILLPTLEYVDRGMIIFPVPSIDEYYDCLNMLQNPSIAQSLMQKYL